MSSLSKIAVFASGEGTNFEAIVTACERGDVAAEVLLLVCDKPSAGVVQRAANHGIDSFVFSPKGYASKGAYEAEIVERLNAKGVELVCLAGYMRIVGETLLGAYRGRIVNIHPSLLPAFRGARAVEQALEYGVKVFGVTIHYVDESLDGGEIIAQRAFEYYGDSAEEVHRLGQKIEHILYPETINKLINR